MEIVVLIVLTLIVGVALYALNEDRTQKELAALDRQLDELNRKAAKAVTKKSLKKAVVKKTAKKATKKKTAKKASKKKK